jgi:methyl coenzyme M reductase subunit C
LANIPEIITKEEFVEVKQAIKNLIKGYEELEEENKTLKGFTSSIFNGTLEKDYIPKSKLREIIEDIDNSQPVIAELKLRKLVEGDK